jgi:hypothetical protein
MEREREIGGDRCREVPVCTKVVNECLALVHLRAYLKDEGDVNLNLYVVLCGAALDWHVVIDHL